MSINDETYFYSQQAGYWVVVGSADPESHASYPEDTVQVPRRPAQWYTWDADRNEWVEDVKLRTSISADAVRYERDRRLRDEVDPVVTNVLRWADLSAEKQKEWATYRRDLLELTEQTGFPDNIIWPDKPE